MTETRPRMAWIDTARGLAILLVVLLHAEQWLATAGLDVGWWPRVSDVATSLRIPLFFTVAGLLAAPWLHRPWADLLGNKVLLLVWVYLLWQPIGSLAAIVASWFTGDQLTPLRMLVSLAATPLRPRFELWFLWALALYFVVARLAVRVPARVQIGAAAVVAGLALSTAVPEVNIGWNGAARFLVFFLAGLYLREHLIAFAGWLRPLRAAGIVTGWFGLALLVHLTGTGGVPFLGLGLRVVGVAAGISLAVLLVRVTWLGVLGARTLPVYLAHNPIIVVVAWLVHLSLGTGWTDRPVIAMAAPVLAVLVAVSGALLLHRLALGGPGRVFYEPPAAITGFVLRRLRGEHRGAHAWRPGGQLAHVDVPPPLSDPATGVIDLREPAHHRTTEAAGG